MPATKSVAERCLELPSDQNASGRTLGDDEINHLQTAIRSGVLTSTKGQFVRQFEHGFASLLNVQHAVACSSGSAAVHTAVAAIDPEPGDEIITSPITDMGALTAILYQGAIPVFADVDPLTYNVTADSIKRCLSPRTRGIVVTHLFGNPCDMQDITMLACEHGLPVLEDGAQALLATYDGRPVGTLGAIGCFSLQQGKHITTGEGGIVVTDDEAFVRRMFLFVNKAWGYGDKNPDHYFLAPNYRMSELQGAVAAAQLGKLSQVVRNRVSSAETLTGKLDGIPGIETPRITPKSTHTYWKYCLRVNRLVLRGGAVKMAELLRSEGIASAPHYIQKPAFMCEVFREQRTFGKSRFPFTLARPEAVDYDPARFPGAFAALDGVLVLPWNEHYTETHIDYIATAVRRAAQQLKEAT